MLLSGTESTGTMAQEREWESFTAMEAAYDRLFTELGIEERGVIDSPQYGLYTRHIPSPINPMPLVLPPRLV